MLLHPKKNEAKDHIINLVMVDNDEQMIHTEPIIYSNIDIDSNATSDGKEYYDGMMVVTIKPVFNDEKFLTDQSEIKLYSYSSLFEIKFYMNISPVLVDDVKWHHVIEIDTIKKKKLVNTTPTATQTNLKVQSLKACKLNTTCDVRILYKGQVNSFRITANNNFRIMSGDQICKYRWVR